LIYPTEYDHTLLNLFLLFDWPFKFT